MNLQFLIEMLKIITYTYYRLCVFYDKYIVNKLSDDYQFDIAFYSAGLTLFPYYSYLFVIVAIITKSLGFRSLGYKTVAIIVAVIYAFGTIALMRNYSYKKLKQMYSKKEDRWKSLKGALIICNLVISLVSIWFFSPWF